jgi:hypothetical protein
MDNAIPGNSQSTRQQQLSRRGFLRLAKATLAAMALPGIHLPEPDDTSGWPTVFMGDLPQAIAAILDIVPQADINAVGYLVLADRYGGSLGPVPLARTKWNQEQSSARARLRLDVPWGIVLHWYGDQESFDKTVSGYLRGFDSLRPVDADDYDLEGYLAELYNLKRKPPLGSKLSQKLREIPAEKIYTIQDPYAPLLYRTSAHFLVGEALPLPEGKARQDAIGILQTQAPYVDGTPLVANHIMPLDYDAYQNGEQYFVLALNQLSRANPQNYSLLQEIYTEPKVFPNQRLIGVEICGYHFDHPDHLPSAQQIANLLAVVWALMKRYNIPATSILGHHELNQGKADPGKKFLALIRYLIGVKSLIDKDEHMRGLVFGQFLNAGSDPRQAVRDYFSLIWNYLALTNTQKQVYEWEALSKYWFVVDQATSQQARLRVAKAYCRPLGESLSWSPKNAYLNPDDHEGVDLYLKIPQQSSQTDTANAVRLMADGVCIFTGETRHCAQGKTLMFRHRQVDGAEVISIYSHLSQARSFLVGESARAGDQIGTLEGHTEGFLHFALAYGATWATDLCLRPEPPLNAKGNWILRRYLQPLQYLQERA